MSMAEKESAPRDTERVIWGARETRAIFPRIMKMLMVSFFILLGAVFTVNLLRSAPVKEEGLRASPQEPEPTTSLTPVIPALLQTASVRQGFPRIAWERELQGKPHLRWGDGRLYVCTQQGEVMALDPLAGTILWDISLGGWISSPPLAQFGNLYVGNANRRLYAMDGRSGRILWFFSTQGEIISSPVCSGGRVLFFADNDAVFKLMNRLYVVDGRTGALGWFYETPNWSKSPPALGESLVYVAGYERKLVALSLEDGREMWSFQAENIINNSPALLGDTLVISTVDGEILGLDALTGNCRWKASLAGPLWTAGCPACGIYLYYDRTGLLSAFRPDGGLAWTFRKEGLLFPLMRDGGGEIRVFDDGGRVHLLDPHTGMRKGIVHLPFSDPVSAEAEGGLIFVASGSGRLICFDEGMVEWWIP